MPQANTIVKEKNQTTTQTTKKTDPKSNKQQDRLLSKNYLVTDILSGLVGEKRELARYTSIVKQILDFEPQIQKLTDEELKAKTPYFKAKLEGLTDKKQIEAKLKEILPEAFAVVREAAFRTLGIKHFPVQLLGGIVLHEGRIAEMKTGEGKTLVSTLPVYLNALPKANQVHLVTVNEYLARRDASEMGEVFNFLGLSIGVIQNQSSFYFQLGASSSDEDDIKREIGLVDSMEDGEIQDKRAVLDVKHLVPCERKRAYWDIDKDLPVDIVYGVNSEFGFDYLRDNMANTPDEIVQKAGLKVAIIDEVDSILIDEARTPLIISAQDEDSSEKYKQFSKLVKQLNPELHYEVDEKRRIVTLTELGIEKVQMLLGIQNLYGTSANVVLIHHLDQALKAHTLFFRDKDYVVKDNEIIIVDEFTGRMMVGRRFNQGLHQALEAKEGVEIKAESKTTATITFQNYFKIYDKLAGMTGTASTESEELFKIYKLLVVSIPTNKPMIREDFTDRIYKSEIGKFTAIVRDIAEIHATGRPILVGTTSIEKNLMLSNMLKDANIPHEVLNANNHEQEARIIAQAGKLGAVTIATNIAGRGIDIKLGGNRPESDEDQTAWKEENKKVKELGGLFVMGTERHESRRIDNQLRGRSGRQGDPGASRFYVSFDDHIIKVFVKETAEYYKAILPVADDEALEHKSYSWLIEQAQVKIESRNFDSRKQVTDYDDVINRQRSVIYTRRRKVLLNDGFHWLEETQKAIYNEIFRIFSELKKPTRKGLDSEEIKKLSTELKNITNLADFDTDALAVLLKEHKYKYPKIIKLFADKVNSQLETRWEIYEDKIKSGMARFTFLRAIDVLWTEHLVTIDHLEDSVRLRVYSQKDPLVEFKQDGMTLFIRLLQEIDKEIADTVFKVNPDLVPAAILNT